ncbi:hypothetical protein [Mycoplasmopsis cynos]|uniref:hypothetical protein n=1 Tax=Mycoplasmopsis cynos TaxID=171284 RepID=UPI003A5C78B9
MEQQIGNLSDITIRALEILKNVPIIACEDTRVTQKLLDKYQIIEKVNNIQCFYRRNYFIENNWLCFK